MRSKLIHVDRWMHVWTDMMKLISTFCEYANTLKNEPDSVCDTFFFPVKCMRYAVLPYTVYVEETRIAAELV